MSIFDFEARKKFSNRRPPGHPVRMGMTGRDRIRQLEREVKGLREALGMREASSEEEWGQHAPQGWRDKVAADALLAEHLNAVNALRRLGFTIHENDRGNLQSVTKVAIKRVFGTPGVRAILARDLEDAETNRKFIVERLVRTAIHGSDENSTRAAQSVARIYDWNEGDKTTAKIRGESQALTLVSFLGQLRGGTENKAESRDTHDLNATIDASVFLTHDPEAEGGSAAGIDAQQDQIALPR